MSSEPTDRTRYVDRATNHGVRIKLSLKRGTQADVLLDLISKSSRSTRVRSVLDYGRSAPDELWIITDPICVIEDFRDAVASASGNEPSASPLYQDLRDLWLALGEAEEAARAKKAATS